MTPEMEVTHLRELLRTVDTALSNAGQEGRWEGGNPDKYIQPARALIQEYFDTVTKHDKADALRLALTAVDRESNPERWETLNDMLVEVENRR